MSFIIIFFACLVIDTEMEGYLTACKTFRKTLLCNKGKDPYVGHAYNIYFLPLQMLDIAINLSPTEADLCDICAHN